MNPDSLKNKVNVTRDNILDGGLRAFAQPLFNPCAQLSVVFVAEDSQDTGGPTREFLRLALVGIQNLRIFQGPSTRRMITLDYTGSIAQY